MTSAIKVVVTVIAVTFPIAVTIVTVTVVALVMVVVVVMLLMELRFLGNQETKEAFTLSSAEVKCLFNISSLNQRADLGLGKNQLSF